MLKTFLKALAPSIPVEKAYVLLSDVDKNTNVNDR